MEKFLFITSIVLVVLYFLLLIDTIIIYRKNKNKRLEEVKERLLLRVKISIVLTTLLALCILLRIIINK